MLDSDYLSKNKFYFENGFYLTSTVDRISKFVTHLDLFRSISELRGEIVECGVFKGCSLLRFVKFRLLLENAFSRKIIAFDTFDQFPEAKYEKDKAKRSLFIEEAGSQSITIEELEALLESNGYNQNIELISGNILETVPDYRDTHPELKIALLHVDVDLYEATKTTLETFFPLVVRGGVVVLDDYGAFPGANKAIDEYFSEANVQIQKIPYSNAISYIRK